MIGKDKQEFKLVFNIDYVQGILRKGKVKVISEPKQLENGDYIYEIEYYD